MQITLRTEDNRMAAIHAGVLRELPTPIEDALQVLEGTSDGDDLSPGDLHLVQCVVNGGLDALTDKGLAHWRAMVEGVKAGTYIKPWLHEQEYLTRDHEGYVYWRGIHVEHYSFRDTKKERAAAHRLAGVCRLIEKRGHKVNASRVSGIWDEAWLAVGMQTPRYGAMWAVEPNGMHSVLRALEGQTLQELAASRDALKEEIGALWGAAAQENLHPTTIATKEDFHRVAAGMVQSCDWARHAFPSSEFWRFPRSAELMECLNSIGEDSLPSEDEVFRTILGDCFADQAGAAGSGEALAAVHDRPRG